MRQLKISPGIMTPRDTKSFKLYLSEVGAISLITAEEEVELAKKIGAGDSAALSKLVNANLRFVISVANQYIDGTCNIEDLVDEGNYGLILAAQRFDHTKGFKFISYAVWWIRRYILEYKNKDVNMIRIPLNKLSDRNKVNDVISRLENELSRKPTIDEIADEGSLGFDVHQVKEILQLKETNVLSYDVQVNEDIDGGATMLDTMTSNEEGADHLVIKSDSENRVNKMMDLLKPKEREVMNLYYGLDGSQALGLKEISEIMSLTRERVRQIKDAACRKLKYKLTKK